MNSRDWQIVQGRIGYEFSTCFRGSELVFKKIIEVFGGRKACASRYGFDIQVQLKLVDGFELDEISYRFLSKDNNTILEEVLEPEDSGGLNARERDHIIKKTREIHDSDEACMAMLSVADLFKVFLNGNQYKSVIVPSVINYGLDATMSHQCAFMAIGRPHNVLLFYEPYGLYLKKKKSYKHCFEKLCGVFISGVEALNTYKVHTYHDYFMPGKSGLQGMMIDQGRVNKAKFLLQYNKIKERMGSASETWKYENDDYDYTFEGSTLMSKVSNNPDFIEDAAILYRNHSAKICVSIFLVESARLIYILDSGGMYSGNPGLVHIKAALGEWYAGFATDATSRLLSELTLLIGSMYPNHREEIFTIFRNVGNSARDICEALTT